VMWAGSIQNDHSFFGNVLQVILELR
jgi:hypothetical protein